MKKLIILFFIFVFGVSGLFAQTPHTFSYQGILIDNSKQPVTGNHHLIIKLYDSPFEGRELHSETFTAQIDNGVFNVVIGSQTPLQSSVAFDKQYWLGVTIDNGAELSPRTALTSVPYAEHSQTSSALSKGATGAVTTINKISGDLMLKAGTDIDLRTEGNTITISAMPQINVMPQSAPWSTGGNTASSGDFIGTTNSQPFIIKTNNLERLRVRDDGGIDIPNTTGANIGVVMKNGNRFVHNYGNDNIFVGELSGNLTMSVNSTSNYGRWNTALGSQTLTANTIGRENTAVGYRALTSNTLGRDNTAVGKEALYSNTGAGLTESLWLGSDNTAVGIQSMYSNTTGQNNTAIGAASLNSNINGIANTALGDFALNANTSGDFNTASGDFALGANTTGSYNTANGEYSMLNNISGSNNTTIGSFSDVASSGLTNASAIGYNAIVGASNSLVLGGTGADAVKVAIGVTIPTETIDVNGTARIRALPASTSTNIVVADANGVLGLNSVANLFPSSSDAWLVGGNSNPSSTVIGNDMAAGNLDVHAGGATRIHIDGTSGYVGIATPLPEQKLDVDGNIKVDNAMYGSGSLFLQGVLPVATLATAGSITLTQPATHYPAGDVILQGGQGSDYYGANLGAKILVKGWSYPGIDEGSDIILQLGNAWGGDRYLKINDESGNTRMTVVSSGNVGIATPAPTQKLDVDGRVRVRNLPVGTDNNLVTANAAGELSVRSVAALLNTTAWSLTGNSGTTFGTNFIGTTDGQNLQFRVNNELAGLLQFDGTSLLLTPDGTTIYNSNTSYGHLAFSNNSTGWANVMLGKVSGFHNTSGYGNTFAGFCAGFANTIGYENTFLGYSVGYKNIGGTFNTFIGSQAGSSNTSGSGNTFTGYTAANSNVSGSYNTFTGAGAASGSTGDYNTSIGFGSLTNNANGAYNTAAGTNANVGAGLMNATAIGAKAYVSASNSLVLGSINGVNTATASTNVGIGTTAPHSSLTSVGSFATKVQNVFPPVPVYAVQSNDHIVTAEPSGGFILITLPTAVGISGRQYTIKWVPNFGGGGAINIMPFGTERIEGAPNYLLFFAWKYVTIVSDGANWLVIGNN
jgi:hypothetical protein